MNRVGSIFGIFEKDLFSQFLKDLSGISSNNRPFSSIFEIWNPDYIYYLGKFIPEIKITQKPGQTKEIEFFEYKDKKIHISSDTMEVTIKYHNDTLISEMEKIINYTPEEK